MQSVRYSISSLTFILKEFVCIAVKWFKLVFSTSFLVIFFLLTSWNSSLNMNSCFYYKFWYLHENRSQLHFVLFQTSSKVRKKSLLRLSSNSTCIFSISAWRRECRYSYTHFLYWECPTQNHSQTIAVCSFILCQRTTLILHRLLPGCSLWRYAELYTDQHPLKRAKGFWPDRDGRLINSSETC